MKTRRALIVGLAFLVWCAVPAMTQTNADAAEFAQDDPGPSLREANQAAQLDLEQLANMDVIVTSASKREENLRAAPAAIYVLTAEDIRHGGFSTIPEALRVVPGLYVAQSNSHSWSVSARGFSDFNNNKMLVLVDGRGLYSQVFGGVSWELEEMSLEDIERIEVIRGPGGTLWGANAINGVINIITKHAEHTQGASVAISAGVNEGYRARVRYGDRIGKNLFYRVYGLGDYWLPVVGSAGVEQHNHWSIPQAGMRMDWEASEKDSLTFEGRGYDGRLADEAPFEDMTNGPYVSETYVVKGGNVLGGWKHRFSDRSRMEALSYCDWNTRTGFTPPQSLISCDAELQHSYDFSARHSLTWGSLFLTNADEIPGRFGLRFNPSRARVNTVSMFAQYEVAVIPDRVRLIAGSKFEHNSITGFEIQPQVRAVWTPNKVHSAWAAVSRAVRTPTRGELAVHFLYARVPSPVPTFLEVVGNPDLGSEHSEALEFGYRYQPAKAFEFDSALFYNRYEKMISFAPGAPQLSQNPLYVRVPIVAGNFEEAQTHGLELGAKWQPTHHWILETGITEDRGSRFAMQSTPEHQFNLQSRLDLGRGLELNGGLYHYGGVPAVQLRPAVPTSNRMDAGISWRAAHDLTLSVCGRNLQSDHHPETSVGPGEILPGEVRRSVVFKLVWHSGGETPGRQP